MLSSFLWMGLALSALSGKAAAMDLTEALDDKNGHWRLAVSPYTLHFHPSPEHRYVWAVGIERQQHNDWLAGASFFSNSFGQESGFLYVGKRYTGLMASYPKLYAQWTAGILYGYKGEYKDKVPFNYRGFSPGVLAGLGWTFDNKWAAQVNILGDAGVMLKLSYDWH
ncbi:MAG: ABC transporter ATP-binding protein [Roseateles sp.]